MSRIMLCDLCQGPIEQEDVRGCIHIPKPTSFEPMSFLERIQSNEGYVTFKGQRYKLLELDICERCIYVIESLRDSHPCRSSS